MKLNIFLHAFKPLIFPFCIVLVGSEVKVSACNAGDLGSIPGSGRSPGEGNGTHSSILAWRIPWMEEPGGLQSTGLQRVRHNWVTSLTWPIFSFSSLIYRNYLYIKTINLIPVICIAMLPSLPFVPWFMTFFYKEINEFSNILYLREHKIYQG